MEFLHNILAQIPDSSAPMLVGVALVLEFIFRLIPSQKPLGWLHIASAGLKLIAAIFSKSAALLDRVLPQRLAPPPGQ